MDRPRPRMLSPPRRFGGNPARNSTGFLDSGSAAYDSYYGYPRSSRESVPGPRGSTDRVEDGRRRYVIPVRDSPPVRRNDDYDVPPRRVEQRGPPKVVTPVQTSRPIVRTAGPISDYQGRPKADEGYYLTPGTSRGHNRASSTSGRTTDRSQYGRQPPPRERHEKVYDRGSRSYHNAPAIRQPRDQNDRDFGYEYTDFKEQARRDLLPVPRQRARRESDVGPRERPASTIGIDDVKRSSRADGPPPSTRGFEKLSRNGEREYRGGSGRVPEPEYEPIQRRRSTRDSDRGSISVHQDRESGTEDGYRKHRRRRGDDEAKDKSSRYEERPAKGEERSKRHHERRASGDDTRRRHRHHRGDSRDYRDSGRDEPEREYVRRRSRGDESERDRRNEPEEDREYRRRKGYADTAEPERHKHHHFGSGAAALGAAATAAGIYAKQRHAHDSDGGAKRGSKDAGRPMEKSSQETMDDSDSDEDPEERRERRRRHRKEREEREQLERLRGGEANPQETTRGNGVLVPQIRADDDAERGRRGSSESSESNESTEKREVRLVSPEREEAKKPKGILKSPKVRFPEDPAPVREGVAPLKEAGKKGIPPNARWTKIDRRLVNPAALDIGNERYEERDEYVIVLRVLSKDEIKLYAAKTAELRDERRREDERRGQMLALEDRAHQYEDEDGPQLQLDDHAYNEEITIPSITATAPPAQSFVAAPPSMSASQPELYASRAAPPSMSASQPELYANRPEAQANSEGNMHRPEAYSSHSYVRMPPSQGSSSMASSISNLSYPAPPPLQSSPQPAQQQPPLGPPGTASYPPPPPPTVYPAGSTAPVYYPPPQGPAGGQQSFPPPQPGTSEPARQQSVHAESSPPLQKASTDQPSSPERRSPQESDGSQRQA